MAARVRITGVTVVALLVVGAYGADAGWHERVADGYRRARAEQDADVASAVRAREGGHAARGSAAVSGPEPERRHVQAPGGPVRTADEAPAEPVDAEPAAPSKEPDPEPAEPETATETAPDPPPEPETEAEPDPPPAPEPPTEPEPTEPEPTEPEPPPEPEPESRPASSGDPASRMAGLVDSLRRDHGAPPLQRSPGLDEVARSWARVLADEGALRHNPDLAEQVRERHGCCRAAENVVHNDPADVDRAHEQMTESSSHRANLLDEKHERIGIGIVIDDENRLWGVQVFHGS